MSIEQGVTNGAPKPVAQTAARQGHGKTTGEGQPPGGFAALLMSLGADDVVVGEGPIAAEVLAPDLLGDAAALAGTRPGVSDEALDPQDGPDPAEALTLTGFFPRQPGAFEPTSAGFTSSRTSALEKASALSDERAGRKAVARAPRDAPTQEQPEAVDTSLQVATEKTASDQTTAAASHATLGAQKQLALAQRMVNKLQAADLAAQAIREKTLQAGESQARGGLQAMEPSAQGRELPLMVQMTVGEAGLRPTERRSERMAPRHMLGEMGAWAGTAQPDGARQDAPMVPGAFGPSPERQVAEQVSYWIGRGVQSAELELAGLGEGPVKVSIVLQGQEAHVDFQTDQVQTRQVLEDSLSHLRELLQREGFVLSGVSVGTSGSPGAGGKQPQARQGSRQALVTAADLQARVDQAGANPSRLSGRSVDLFV